jgi:hypothetical protein
MTNAKGSKSARNQKTPAPPANLGPATPRRT